VSIAPEIADLRDRIATLRGPSVAKCQASLRSSRKARAGLALVHALSVLRWSRREAARHVGVDERVVRDWIEGSRQPAWIPLALPRDGYLAYLDSLLGDVPPESRTGTEA